MKKKIISLLLVFVLCIACLTGCSLLTTNSKRNLKVVVAEVNIAEVYKAESDCERKNDFATVLEDEKITKQEVLEFYNSSEASNYEGSDYETTLVNILKEIARRRVQLQYEIMYIFELAEKDSAYSNYSYDNYKSYIEAYNEAEDGNFDVYKWKFFLNQEHIDEYTYSLKKSFNNSIDTYEQRLLDEDEKESNADLRTVPTNAGVEDSEFYDTAYKIYTGFNDANNCSYEVLEGSTKKTRQKAYNTLLTNLKTNGDLKDSEDVNNVESLEFYQKLLAKQFRNAISSQFDEILEDVIAKEVATEEYITERFNKIYENQVTMYDASCSDFESAFSSISESSSVLYTPTAGKNFGYVYNILLPFNAEQTQKLSTVKNNNALSLKEYYENRELILTEIKGKDLRTTWFGGAEEYEFIATDYQLTAGSDFYKSTNGSDYLFFEDNFNGNYKLGEKSKFATIEKYTGKYAFNGSVSYDKDKDKYTLKANDVTIDDLLNEIKAYLEFNGVASSFTLSSSYDASNSVSSSGDVDYSKFIYATGSADIGTVDLNTLLVDDTSNKAYTAMSAINELQFVYSTDPGCLNTYLGYSISPYTTDYVKEFEYAAQQVVKAGVGNFAVVATDYGWHFIYCTYAVTTEGDNYTFNWADVESENEGTFSYTFYNTIKDTMINQYVTSFKNDIINVYYEEDDTVNIFEKRYQDWKVNS